MMLKTSQSPMRISQFVRHYDITAQEVMDYLNHLDPEGKPRLHANAKITDEEQSSVMQHFGLYEPVSGADEVSEEKKEVSHEIQSNQTDEAEPPEEVLNDKEAEETENLEPPAGTREITSEELLESLESENNDLDFSEIKRIKAPKKALKGLKVVDKIELPDEPRPTKKKETPSGENLSSEKRKKRPSRSEEEREKRRLRAKKKKEAAEARKEKQRKKSEQKRLKALKEQHYRQRVQKSTVNPNKRRKKSQKAKPTSEQTSVRPARPKNIWGRFWWWLTNPPS